MYFYRRRAKIAEEMRNHVIFAAFSLSISPVLATNVVEMLLSYFSYIHTFRHYLFPLFVNIAIDINIIIRIITNVTYVSLIATVTITIYCHYYINYHLYHYGYYF